ncbi:MAG: L-amino acid N-acyltransferase [Actinomycetota bacterium]|jgi:phosphinothricin acetyltransferase
MEVRLAIPSDAEAIRAIYNVEVSESTNTFDLVPRTVEQQQAWLADHAGAHPAIVAVSNGAVVGYGSLSPYKERPAYATTVEDSLFVHREHRGEGVGRNMLEELLRLAADHGFHAVIARIVGDNAASIRVHEACEFERVGVEREVGRKFGRWLDVVELQRLL